jgi:hypothetical protein
MALLSRGENFGHAIYESLSVGRPVINSTFTPWNNLTEQKAGVNVDISSIDDCRRGIEYFHGLDQEVYNTYCNGAHNVANNFFYALDSFKKYPELFS